MSVIVDRIKQMLRYIDKIKKNSPTPRFMQIRSEVLELRHGKTSGSVLQIFAMNAIKIYSIFTSSS
jgi:hypothetical protein